MGCQDKKEHSSEALKMSIREVYKSTHRKKAKSNQNNPLRCSNHKKDQAKHKNTMKQQERMHKKDLFVPPARKAPQLKESQDVIA